MSTGFGSVFAESIFKVKKTKGYPKESGKEIQVYDNNRLYLFLFILIFGLGFLLTRLFSLSFFEGQRYRRLSTENRIREAKVIAPRGIIYDRKGIPLVRNIPVFQTKSGLRYFDQKEVTESGEVTEGVARQYIYGPLLSHVLGYTGEVNEEEIRSLTKQNNYKSGDIIGKMGIEKTYDSLLRGRNGKVLTEVDALGSTVRQLGKVEPKSGENLSLTLDLDLQKIGESDFKGKKGAIVITEPKTGAVLGLYSSPSYDPNNFITGVNIDNLLNDSDHPLFNRAISGNYPPGSTFKIITSTAALETGAITRETKFEDTGVLQVGQFTFGNWYFNQYGRKEGILDIVGALKRSNDIFFYKTGEATGIENIALWAKKMGVENILRIDLEGEEKGVMPDPSWQKKVRGQDWYLGNTYHVAIGQGDILTTPLQVNAWTNVIANGGKLCRPHLTKEQNENCKDVGIKKENLELIRQGMKEACSSGGTGWPLFKFKVQSSKFKADNLDFLQTYEATVSGKPMVEIPVACKTGTSEFGDPKNRTHAWFTVFAPVYNPQISITVLVEGGGEGSNVAAPIAKKILEEWFGR